MKSTFKKGGIQESRQGQILDSRKWGGGAQRHCSEHDNSVGSTHSGNFEISNPLRLNLRAFLMVYCLYYSKTLHCKIISA